MLEARQFNELEGARRRAGLKDSRSGGVNRGRTIRFSVSASGRTADLPWGGFDRQVVTPRLADVCELGHGQRRAHCPANGQPAPRPRFGVKLPSHPARVRPFGEADEPSGWVASAAVSSCHSTSPSARAAGVGSRPPAERVALHAKLISRFVPAAARRGARRPLKGVPAGTEPQVSPRGRRRWDGREPRRLRCLMPATRRWTAGR